MSSMKFDITEAILTVRLLGYSGNARGNTTNNDNNRLELETQNGQISNFHAELIHKNKIE